MPLVSPVSNGTPSGLAYLDIAKTDLRLALDTIAAVKAAVGDHVDLLIEGHGRFNIPTAVRIARELERFDILWFEEPVPPDNLMRSARSNNVAAYRSPPASALQPLEASRFLEMGCADYIQPDVSHCGGIGELKRLPPWPSPPRSPYARKSQRPGGQRRHSPVSRLHAQFLHSRNHGRGRALRGEICSEQVGFSQGRMTISDAPGLGIDLNEEAMAQHPYELCDLRHYTGKPTDIRPADATSYLLQRSPPSQS